ncbi:glycosyltransferase [Brasilonema sp. UFV-L1]|uniref:glycosyltransferase n=1 Tax=Brasilonema sp. UFV-L1 TaxID=2234130 RepID=UPI00145F3DEF|nr:glycosyltransferase [Brasilonema sp. UFV-L1]NMG10785.1 glycosyl transferase family 1 [Brasilonema sp. UFV-L1]
MTHFGMICPSAVAHISTMTSLGWELKQRGHQVTLLGLPYAEAKAVALGLGFRTLGKFDITSERTVQKHTKAGEMVGLAALRSNLKMVKEDVAVLLRDAPEAIKSEGIEALLVDQTSYEGGSVAQLLDIPFVSVCSGLLLHPEDSIPPFFTSWAYNPSGWARLRNKAGYKLINYIEQPILELVREYRQEWKLPWLSHPSDSYSQLAQLSQQPIEFEFPRTELPKCFHFMGTLANEISREPVSFPFEKLTGQPLIYASMGTLQNRQMRIFQCIAEACVGLDIQLVISLGGGNSPESLPELPGSPLVVSYAPQLELLKKATLVITHGGASTVLESLKNGVPMVAIPITYDQPGVGARLVWTGAGEVVSLSRLNVARLRTAIQRVLNEDTYKKNASKLQEAIQRAGGVTRAVDIIEKAISTGKPVINSQLT